MITDADLRILSVNHAFSQITGYAEDEVIGCTPEFLGAGVHDKHFFRRILGELEGSGRWQGDVWNRRKSGEVCPEWLSLSAVEGADSAVENYIWVFADVSDIKRTRTKLEYIAHHDPLTDLPNRLLFNTRLKHALDRAQRGVNQLAVLLLDLDRFKNINDSFGHPVGDLLLSMAAGRMQSCLRREDTMARIGGDEFAVLLEGIDDGKAAARVADKLIQALAPSFRLKGVETFITASIGIAVYPLDGQTSTKLMRNADAALFVAKGEGRNTFRYYRREMTADARERLTMEAALRRAIDNDEFEVWYQPQVNLNNGRFIGAEALVRWRDPARGLVPPNRFIPLAEETGLIIPLGERVLRMACAQAESWRAMGIYPGRISVNVAGPQIERGDIAATVQQVLAETLLPPPYLELEITEGFIMRSVEAALQTLERLKELGIWISIDDFGTGYSSLSYLKRLPVDQLKIDQGFVRGIPQDADAAAITTAVIALAQSMGYMVIAEGVESDEQRRFLLDEGCRYGQGFLYSKPLDSAAFEEWLNRYAKHYAR
ncbi:MAG: hypothetical protein B0D84_05805 [Candidatus Sedimenticola endophacoides]|uniref:cyclic-guanylate-specific phosphodiesterase n=1 Tax=Candidatus Sedimenticola endophacoides TaxID=2548426 RepID=A0A657PMI8_9GAMM|nr:MAG: hypothetical protein B0D84_05805 [Candidatus Sedimenticola endophacoides]